MAKNIKLSSTRISTFLSCTQKYWFNYHERLPRIGNDSFKLGTSVHESLEFAGHIWKKKEKFTKTDIKKILEKYDQVSISEGLSDQAVHLEGRDLVKKRLKNFITGKKVIGLEEKFGFWGKDGGAKVTSKLGVPLMGSIDKAEEFDDDTLLIIDYKTSKTAPTASQMKHDIQLSLYDLAARQMFPKYKRIILSLDLLRSDMLYTYRTDAQREVFEEYLKTIYESMTALKEEDVKASLNMFCPWCSYKDYCTTYQKACKKVDYNFLPVMKYSNEELITEWENVRAVSKILDSRKRELDMVMLEKIKKDFKTLSIDDKEVYIRQNSSTNYDLDTVYEAVPDEDFPSIVNLNKKAVKMYMDLNPSVKPIIEETATTNYTSPFLATRKIKIKK